MTNVSDKQIAVLGVGMIGGTLVERLIASNQVDASNIFGSTAHEDTAEEVAETYGIHTTTDNRELVRDKDVVILAVEPQYIGDVLDEIHDVLTADQIVISIAAATSTEFIEDHLNKSIPVIRGMPNTPVLVNEGMTVLCGGEHATDEHLHIAEDIFKTTGNVEIIDREDLMDAVTAMSGSGPAYTYIFIEALAEAGVKVGLPRDLATTLAAQAVTGGSKMVLETEKHPALLKDQVTTPAGVTVDGLMELEDGGLRVTLIKAVSRATEKSKEVSGNND
jgi:pyrroline-5-carboxylate reductase